MSKAAHFKVDPKLAELLGETYRSIEEATKELVDNSYDADAENVIIRLPNDLDPNPTILIDDDGTGMKEQEIRKEYLHIANSRTSRKGDRSIAKKRKVKGRKGIGKFAGLMVASEMKIETRAGGKVTTLTINKDDLVKANYDLEKIPLPIEVEECHELDHGTTIVLRGLNQNLNYPNQDRLKEILMRDYGRENDFSITINGADIGVLDLHGQSFEREIELQDGKKARLQYTITDKPVKQSGLAVRVNNKIIGRPKNFLSDDEVIPKKLQGRVYGEIICDDLEDDVTADFGAVIDNSKLFEEVSAHTTDQLRDSVDEVFKKEMKMARARYQRKINKELEKLPEFKQPFAKKALFKTLEKFYGEAEDRINTVLSVMVSAMEKDHYWDIIQNIQESRNDDVEQFANSLTEFGLIEKSIVTSQAINRLRFLDELNVLIDNPKSLESTIHKVFEKNTWLLGDDYSVMLSDQGLKSAIEEVVSKKYQGENPNNRPDLFLGRSLTRTLTLIEFKRPGFTLNRDAESQALAYRDELNQYFHDQMMDIILLGGAVEGIDSPNEPGHVQFRTYEQVISMAREKLSWLIEEVTSGNPVK